MSVYYLFSFLFVLFVMFSSCLCASFVFWNANIPDSTNKKDSRLTLLVNQLSRALYIIIRWLALRQDANRSNAVCASNLL